MFPRFKYPAVKFPQVKYARFRHSRSPRPLFRDAYRLVRRPSKITLGAAAATVVAAAAIAAGVSAGSSSTPSAPNDLAQAQHATAAHQPAGHDAGGGQAAAARASNGKAPASHQAPAQHAPAKNYLLYDSVLPSALPAHQAVATYASGPFAVSPSQLAGHKTVLWIDTVGTDYNASILDIEPGDATPAMAASWVSHRLRAHRHSIARLYTTIAEWSAVRASVAQLPASMRSQVRYWIADPTGTPHLVPGSDATQWYWGSTYDLSTATPRF